MDIKRNGDIGYSTYENTMLTFQVGETPLTELLESAYTFDLSSSSPSEGYLHQVEGFRVLTRGTNDTEISDVSRNIKENRLLPELIEKQVKMLYGEGIFLYRPTITEEGKLIRKWTDNPEVTAWLDSWNDTGFTEDHLDLAIAIIRRYYYFEDFFILWRFRLADFSGRRTVAGFELVENSRARLATDKDLGVSRSSYVYDDFNHILIGDWRKNGRFNVYPRFSFRDIHTYNVAVSHHGNDDVDNFYGRNKSYGGSKEWVEAANENPKFVRSFLRNALAAKVHVVIPNEWVESKKQMISNLCRTNQDRLRAGKELLTLNGIQVGTQFNESLIVEYTNKELQKLTKYLSGAENQGKLYATYSYRNKDGEPVEWKIEHLDMKYKEYIEALLSFDRRADEVMVGAKGLDPSISNVSKEGIISKSGSDSYYNYIIYQNQLSPAEKVCCDPFNMALRVNFPEVYSQGFRLGFYRNVPEKQQDISPENRLSADNNEN